MSNFIDVIKQFKKLCSCTNCYDDCPILAEFHDYK